MQRKHRPLEHLSVSNNMKPENSGIAQENSRRNATYPNQHQNEVPTSGKRKSPEIARI
jgi:hypothetical protein